MAPSSSVTASLARRIYCVAFEYVRVWINMYVCVCVCVSDLYVLLCWWVVDRLYVFRCTLGGSTCINRIVLIPLPANRTRRRRKNTGKLDLENDFLSCCCHIHSHWYTHTHTQHSHAHRNSWTRRHTRTHGLPKRIFFFFFAKTERRKRMRKKPKEK